MQFRAKYTRIILSGLLFLGVTPFAANGLSFTITDLGTLGDPYSYGEAINDLGQATGFGSIGDGARAFLYTEGDGMTNLGTRPGAYSSYGTDINNSGQVTGRSGDRAFLTNGNGVAGTNWDLGSLAGGETAGYGVNDHGQVTGHSRLGTSEVHAFLSDGTGNPGSMTDLGTLGGTFSWGRAINNDGWVAGASTTASGEHHAFLSDGTADGMFDIGSLNGGRTDAYGINNLGQVVGDSNVGGTDYHAYVYSVGSGMVDLGTLGGSYSRANGINDAGWIVGYSAAGPGELGGAFVYIEALGGMLNLNDLTDPSTGWRMHNALEVNNLGQIVGYGSFNGGHNHALLFTPDTLLDNTPIPEPASFALLGMGLVGLATRRRR